MGFRNFKKNIYVQFYLDINKLNLPLENAFGEEIGQLMRDQSECEANFDTYNSVDG